MTIEAFGVALLVSVAAGTGAVARYLAAVVLNRELPIGTLAVNLAASAALGLVVAADDPIPTVVGIGGLGALSTWSALANEAAGLARAGNARLGLAYLGLSVSSGILAAWFGLKLGAAWLG